MTLPGGLDKSVQIIFAVIRDNQVFGDWVHSCERPEVGCELGQAAAAEVEIRRGTIEKEIAISS